MRSVQIKYVVSASIAVLILASLPAVGLTTASADDNQGMMIDFGYWNTVWIDMSFSDDMDGYSALETACHIKGYDIIYLDDGSVYSIDGQTNLTGISWALYSIRGSEWMLEADPSEVKATGHSLLCWARSSGEEAVMPGTDSTGYSYYNYAVKGVSLQSGEKLRVVSLAPSVTETLCSVSGIDYIIGTDLYSNYPEKISELKENGHISVVGGYTDPNYEWIIKICPDVVFCDGGTGEHVSIADKLRKSGINCVVLYDCKDIETLYSNIWITASSIGFSENANSVIYGLRKTMDVVSGISGDIGKRVFVSLSADPSPWTSGSDTFMTDVLSSVGGYNVFSSQSSSWFMVSKEQIYAKQPDVIIIISSSPFADLEGYQSIIDGIDPVWKETPAFRNGEVYVFSESAGDILSRPGPRLSEAAEILAKILNQEAFASFDPLDTVPKYLGDDYQEYLSYQAALL